MEHTVYSFVTFSGSKLLLRTPTTGARVAETSGAAAGAATRAAGRAFTAGAGAAATGAAAGATAREEQVL